MSRRFGFIRDHAHEYPVSVLCDTLEVSRSGYYAWCRRPESRRCREDRSLKVSIRALFRECRQVYGSPRIYRELRKQGFSCSEKRVARLMRESNLRAVQARKYRVTTDSNHSHPVACNLLAQKFDAHELNRVWLGDITYIPTREGWLYLAAILDLASRKIVGWSMSERIDLQLTLAAFQMAVEQRQPNAELIHHSDRGSQYAALAYQQALAAHGIRASMSRRGNCYDNAPMESFFHTLKVEQVHRCRYQSRSQARADLFEYIEIFYNRRRAHSSIGYLSPVDYERQCRLREAHLPGRFETVAIVQDLN